MLDERRRDRRPTSGSPRPGAPRSRGRRRRGVGRLRVSGSRSGASPGRTRRGGRCIDADAVENLLEDPLDPFPHLCVEAVARHVDQAGEEASEPVLADEEPDALPLPSSRIPMAISNNSSSEIWKSSSRGNVSRISTSALSACSPAEGPSARASREPCGAGVGSHRASRCRRSDV